MANPTKLVVDCGTGEAQEVELTDAEVTQMQADADAWSAQQAEIQAAEDAKAAAKASAITKLAKLGLSDAEIAALIG